MNRQPRALATCAILTAAALSLAACTSSGGGRPDEPEGDGGGGGGQVADTPRLEIAVITHAAPGDTFWDIVRSGAEDAAAKDNVELNFLGDPEAARQATLIQNAVDSGVDGIAVTMSKPEALADAIHAAQEAGIPVVGFNSGINDWQEIGVDAYFGSDEDVAGRAAGERLTEEGAKKALCVIQEQGHVALEARCAGVKATFPNTENITVTGTDMPSVQSTLTAKLQQDPSIDRIITLGAPFALAAVQVVADAGSEAKVATFDMNAELAKAIQDGTVLWSIDQQPYLQGYLAVDSLWLNATNANTIGGGQPVLTGPAFVDETNIDRVAEYAAGGTR